MFKKKKDHDNHDSSSRGRAGRSSLPPPTALLSSSFSSHEQEDDHSTSLSFLGRRRTTRKWAHPHSQHPQQPRRCRGRWWHVGCFLTASAAAYNLGRQRNQLAILRRTLTTSTTTTITTTMTKTAAAASTTSRWTSPPHKVTSVALWTTCGLGGSLEGAATRHVWEDGLDESPWLERIPIMTTTTGSDSNFSSSSSCDNIPSSRMKMMTEAASTADAWIAVVGQGLGFDRPCEHLLDRVQVAINMSIPRQSWPTTTTIHVVDYTDSTVRIRCHEVERLVGRSNVRYAKRSVVQGRQWRGRPIDIHSKKRKKKNKKLATAWVKLGRLMSIEDGSNASSTTTATTTTAASSHSSVRHVPFAVRTDTVETLQSVLEERGLTLKDRIESSIVDRFIHVTHLWPRSDASDRGGVGSGKSNLRSVVSDALWTMSHQHNRNWTLLVDVVGTPARAGRHSVASSYLDTLLSTQIMVVTQRDNWEDHYRLMEALVAGPLVFTDRMLSLPSGLANGTSIVEFGSLQELERLLDYYLAHPLERQRIAGEGRRIAMTYHRSWHRVEEVIFGKPMSVCPEDDDDPNCPYVVHANESTAAAMPKTMTKVHDAFSSATSTAMR